MKEFKTLLLFLSILPGMILFSSCEKDETTKNEPPVDYSFHESFDSLAVAVSQRGWLAINNSRPLGVSTWSQGIYRINPFFGNFEGFPANSSIASANEYAYCDYTCGDDIATISCWLISPVLNIQNGDVISFWTRVADPPITFPDRLQVYANFKNDGTNVGTDAESLGDFDLLLFDINPDLTTTDYPTSWEKYEWTVSGINASGRIKARIGFRYYVTNAGPNGANSSYLGIDDFELKAN